MARVARIVMIVYALATLATTVLFGGVVWVFMTGDMKTGVGQMILLSIPFNTAFAVLAGVAGRRPSANLVLMALGPAYAVLGLLLMQFWGFFDPRSDMLFVWPAYPWKAIATVVVGFILWRDGKLRSEAGGEGV